MFKLENNPVLTSYQIQILKVFFTSPLGLEAKDYLDLYFILKETSLDFDRLFDKTKRKDLGLHEFYFGNIVIDAIGRLGPFPQTLKPFNEKELKDFFLELGERLLKRIKPPAT